ncbi:hypothetical protein [Cupriavidus metallidurans]|uniref:hypothetical protein n=1 Tax=Cupriavidus metallidurans TaxID=119219 RepID=UPI0007883CEC|nr:hypothetical protein [Cupriavidus metallidurans]
MSESITDFLAIALTATLSLVLGAVLLWAGVVWAPEAMQWFVGRPPEWLLAFPAAGFALLAMLEWLTGIVRNRIKLALARRRLRKQIEWVTGPRHGDDRRP